MTFRDLAIRAYRHKNAWRADNYLVQCQASIQQAVNQAYRNVWRQSMAETEYEMRQVGDKTFIDYNAFITAKDEQRRLDARLSLVVSERDAAIAMRNHEKQRADRVTQERDALNAKVFTVDGRDVIAVRDATIARLQSKCDKQSADITRLAVQVSAEEAARKTAERQRDWLIKSIRQVLPSPAMAAFYEAFPGWIWHAVKQTLIPCKSAVGSVNTSAEPLLKPATAPSEPISLEARIARLEKAVFVPKGFA